MVDKMKFLSLFLVLVSALSVAGQDGIDGDFTAEKSALCNLMDTQLSNRAAKIAAASCAAATVAGVAYAFCQESVSEEVKYKLLGLAGSEFMALYVMCGDLFGSSAKPVVVKDTPVSHSRKRRNRRNRRRNN